MAGGIGTVWCDVDRMAWLRRRCVRVVVVVVVVVVVMVRVLCWGGVEVGEVVALSLRVQPLLKAVHTLQ
jgi:hypothetical protein